MKQQLETVRDLNRQNLDLAGRYHSEVLRNSMRQSVPPVRGSAGPSMLDLSPFMPPNQPSITMDRSLLLDHSYLQTRADASPPKPAVGLSSPGKDATAGAAASTDGGALHVSELTSAAAASPGPSPGLDVSTLNAGPTAATVPLAPALSAGRTSVAARLTREIADLRNELEQANQAREDAVAALHRCVGAERPARRHGGVS